MKIAHLWWDYSPTLFDRSHPLCIAHGIESEVACQSFINNGAVPLPGTFFVRERSPEESNSKSIFRRIIRRLRRSIDAVRFARLVQSRVRTFNPDILHIHFGTTAAVLYDLGALPDLPMMVSFYGVDISQSLKDPKTVQAYQHVFKRTCLMHALCDDVRNRIVAIGCPPNKIRIANLPTDLDKIPDIGVERTGKTRFLIAARFVEKKGHEILLNALKGLINDGYKVCLTCFGYGSEKWLEKRVEELGIGNAVRVINNNQSNNFIAEYMEILRSHDVVVAPSIIASSGDDEAGPQMSLVIAQAAGKPSITSDFPGHERSVTNREHGLVVPMGDVIALQQAMAEMTDNITLWQRFGQSGRARVLQEFTDATYWQFLDNCYRELL